MFGDGEQLLARFHRARPGHDDDFLAANFQAIGKLNDGAFGTEAASRQLVGRADAVDLFDAGQHFEIASIEIDARAHRGQDGLPLAGGAVHGEAHARTRCSTTCWICSSVADSCMATIIMCS